METKSRSENAKIFSSKESPIDQHQKKANGKVFSFQIVKK